MCPTHPLCLTSVRVPTCVQAPNSFAAFVLLSRAGFGRMPCIAEAPLPLLPHLLLHIFFS